MASYSFTTYLSLYKAIAQIKEESLVKTKLRINEDIDAIQALRSKKIKKNIGYTIYTCSCGYSYTAQDIAAYGHDFSEKSTSSTYLKSSGSCVAYKTYYYKCSRCTASSKNNGNSYWTSSTLGSHNTYGAYTGGKASDGCTLAQWRCRNCSWTGSTYHIAGSGGAC